MGDGGWGLGGAAAVSFGGWVSVLGRIAASERRRNRVPGGHPEEGMCRKHANYRFLPTQIQGLGRGLGQGLGRGLGRRLAINIQVIDCADCLYFNRLVSTIWRGLSFSLPHEVVAEGISVCV